MLFDRARHEPLVDAAWDPQRARAAIDWIVRDAEASYAPGSWWPVHPRDLEPGEDPYTACTREVKEETGLDVPSPQLRALLGIAVQSTGHLWVLFVFTAGAPGGTPVASDEGELRWVAGDRVNTLPVTPDLPLILPHVLSASEVLVIRSDLETEDTASMRRLEIVGPSSHAAVLYQR